MKANHNLTPKTNYEAYTVTNINISKNESKSQQGVISPNTNYYCNKYQYFKE